MPAPSRNASGTRVKRYPPAKSDALPRGKRPTSFDIGLRCWRFYVYHLVDPRDGAVFYVGKGRERRMFYHEVEAELGMLTEKCERIRQIWRAGFEVEKRIVGLFTDSSPAYWHEAHQIEIYGARLTNGKRLPQAYRKNITSSGGEIPPPSV